MRVTHIALLAALVALGGCQTARYRNETRHLTDPQACRKAQVELEGVIHEFVEMLPDGSCKISGLPH